MVPGALKRALLLWSIAIPMAISASSSQPAASPPTVVLLGASYAEGWSLTLPGMQVVNKGVTGQQSFELLARFDTDVTPLKPRAVIVWGFINDVFRAPEGRLDESLTRTRRSVEEIVARARQAGIEPILATEVTLRTEPQTWTDTFASWIGALLGKTSYQAQVNASVLATNAWLREYAGKEGILLLDLQPVVSDASTGARLPECSAPDGSHISEEGYRRLSSHAVPLLRDHFDRRTP
jgi:acyl-CoA thioesterase I